MTAAWDLCNGFKIPDISSRPCRASQRRASATTTSTRQTSQEETEKVPRLISSSPRKSFFSSSINPSPFLGCYSPACGSIENNLLLHELRQSNLRGIFCTDSSKKVSTSVSTCSCDIWRRQAENWMKVRFSQELHISGKKEVAVISSTVSRILYSSS